MSILPFAPSRALRAQYFLPDGPTGSAAALFRVLKACRLGFQNQLFQTPLHSWRIAESFSWVPQPRLSRRKRQSIDPPQHTGKQPPRQMTLRQQQPIIAGMFHQPAARLHQPLLEPRQRPAPDPLRQNQPPPKVAEIVGCLLYTS